MDWRASSRLSVHENLGATGFAGNVCECPNKREGFNRPVATLHLDVATHFPVAVARDDRIFAGWKISYGLRGYAFARNLTVLASQRKLRSGRIGLDFKSPFASHKSKRRKIWQVFTSQVNVRFHGFVSGAHNAQVIFARF